MFDIRDLSRGPAGDDDSDDFAPALVNGLIGAFVLWSFILGVCALVRWW